MLLNLTTPSIYVCECMHSCMQVKFKEKFSRVSKKVWLLLTVLSMEKFKNKAFCILPLSD